MRIHNTPLHLTEIGIVAVSLSSHFAIALLKSIPRRLIDRIAPQRIVASAVSHKQLLSWKHLPQGQDFQVEGRGRRRGVPKERAVDFRTWRRFVEIESWTGLEFKEDGRRVAVGRVCGINRYTRWQYFRLLCFGMVIIIIIVLVAVIIVIITILIVAIMMRGVATVMLCIGVAIAMIVIVVIMVIIEKESSQIGSIFMETR